MSISKYIIILSISKAYNNLKFKVDFKIKFKVDFKINGKNKKTQKA